MSDLPQDGWAVSIADFVLKIIAACTVATTDSQSELARR
jgi:hypothetical protein